MPSLHRDVDAPERIGAVPQPGRGDRVGDERDAARRRRSRAGARRRGRGGRRRRSPGRRRPAARARRRRCPGRGASSGRIALNTWVTVRTPRSNAAWASVRGRVRCGRARRRRRARGARRRARARRAAPARASSARTGPAARSRSSSANVGVAAVAGGWVPSRAARGTALRGALRGRGARRRGRPASRASAATSSASLRGDERRQERGHAGLEQRIAGHPVAVGIRAEQVDAREAVHLQVDEPRRRRCRGRCRRRGRSRRRRRPRPRRRPARARPSTRHASNAEPHWASAFRTTPSAAVEPASRLVGVDAREQRDDRDLRVATGGGERGVDLARDRLRSPGCTIRWTRARSFSFVATTSTIRFAVRLAEPDHRDRRDLVEDELLRGARLEARRAGDHLGPDDDGDLVVGKRGRARSREPRRARP